MNPDFNRHFDHLEEDPSDKITYGDSIIDDERNPFGYIVAQPVNIPNTEYQATVEKRTGVKVFCAFLILLFVICCGIFLGFIV